MKRICIYTSDIVRITGRSESYARKLLRQIRKHYAKPKGAIVTVTEFCTFLKWRVEDVERYL